MKTRLFLLLAALSWALAAASNPPSEEGKAIFTSRCASCHNVNKVLTGPALAGLHERRSMDWIIRFVQSSQSMVKSGDKEAVALFNQFNRIPMPDHPDLTANHIQNIVEYIKGESSAIVTEKAPFARPHRQPKSYTPLTFSDYRFMIGFPAAVILLVLSLLLAVKVKEVGRRAQGEQPERF